MAERTKAGAVEGKLKEQLLARERELAAVQARMQASYQDHVSETQQLQGKVSPTLCSSVQLLAAAVAFGERCRVRGDQSLGERMVPASHQWCPATG